MATIELGVSPRSFERPPPASDSQLEVLDETRIIPRLNATRLIGNLASYGDTPPYSNVVAELRTALDTHSPDDSDIILNPQTAHRLDGILGMLGADPLQYGIRPLFSGE